MIHTFEEITDLGRSVGLELVIFVVTLIISLAFRSFSDKHVAKKVGARARHRSIRLQGGDQRTLSDSGDLHIMPTCRNSGIGPGRRQPGRIMDEVVQGMRECHDLRFAAKMLEWYAEFQNILKEEGINMSDAAKDSRHSPLDFYTALVLCVMKLGKCDLVECLIDDMIQNDIPRPFTFYESMMKQLASRRQHRLALRVHDKLTADGLEPSAVMCSCLVSFAAEAGEFDRALGFFKKLSSCTTPSIRAYMTILQVHGRRQDWPASLASLRDMQRRGVTVDSLVLNVILATGISAHQLQGVEALLTEAENYVPPIADNVSYNTLLKGHARCHDYHAAVGVIQRMRKRGLAPNAISFNSLMDAAVRSCNSNEAWQLLEEMRNTGLQPDNYTCSILIKGLKQNPSAAQTECALDLLCELGSVYDVVMRRILYHAVVDAAMQVGNVSVLNRALNQMQQHQVTPSPAVCQRVRELEKVQNARFKPARKPIVAHIQRPQALLA